MATWQVAPTPGESLSHGMKTKQNAKISKYICTRIIGSCLLHPAHPSMKEMFLCRTDGTKRYKGKKCRDGFLFKRFHPCLFLRQSTPHLSNRQSPPGQPAWGTLRVSSSKTRGSCQEFQGAFTSTHGCWISFPVL